MAIEDIALQGQVFVDSYFDYESVNTYILDDSAPVGTAYFGSEDAYIIMADVPEYRFGGGLEADLVSYAYDFTFTFGNGDYYTGTVYAVPEYGYSTVYTQTATAENGQTGVYTIALVTSGLDVSLAGQVTVIRYDDVESGNTYTGDLGSGTGFLESESGHIIAASVDDFFFGNQDGVVYEADLAVQYSFTHYYDDGGGDRYSGTVYAPEGFYGDTLPSTTENGPGHYDISVAAYLEDVSQYGQVTVDSYYDGESDNTYLAADGEIFDGTGTENLGSESGYIRIDGIPEYYFGAETPGGIIYEADLVIYAYAFTTTYGNGDFYCGTVYAAPEYEYDVGYMKTFTDENGQLGYYEITDLTPGSDGVAGQVFVDMYYDAESAALQPIATNNPVGEAYLGSEVAYICMEDIPEYRFGAGQECCYEADLCSYAYEFTLTYGNGDYYRGTVYAEPEIYGLENLKELMDENGQIATYAIATKTCGLEVNLAGQVFVDTYYDQESNFTYTPVHAGSVVGTDYLGSERDYILFDGMVLNRFGVGPAGSEATLYEADVTSYQNWANRLYEPARIFYLNYINYWYRVYSRYYSYYRFDY